MVKSLVSSGDDLIATEHITPDDLELAKTILREKFMILLIDDKFGSWRKVDAYMGWPYFTQERKKCEDSVLNRNWPEMTQDQPHLERNEEAYWHLVERNRWDVELYEFAVLLFHQQTEALVK